MENNDIYARPSEEKSNWSWEDTGKMFLTGGLMMPKQLSDEKKKRALEDKIKNMPPDTRTEDLNAMRAELEALKAYTSSPSTESDVNKDIQDAMSQDTSSREGGKTKLFLIIGGVLGLAVAGFFVYKAVRKKK